MKKKEKKHKNVLYTGKGDDGTTTLFNCHQGRVSKSSNVVEALGSLDEFNSFLGIVKVYSELNRISLKIKNKNIFLDKIIEKIQQNLFIIQAELGGSRIFLEKKEINYMENIIKETSELLPPIKSFTISGGSITSSLLDYSRTLARRAERRVIAVCDEGLGCFNDKTLTYLNRLSSLLFALSRFTNFSFSIEEKHPNYNKRQKIN